MEVKLAIPQLREESTIFPWVEDMWDVVDEHKVFFDFSQLTYAFPFCTLVFASAVRDFVRHRKMQNSGLTTYSEGINYSISAHSYLGYIGFFRFIGLNQGNEPGQAYGSSSYIPITPITRRQLSQQKDVDKTSLGPAIQREAEKLSQIVLSHNKPLSGHPVPYCFREIIRNTFEHGETNICMLSAQRWCDNTLEIAIVDWGCG